MSDFFEKPINELLNTDTETAPESPHKKSNDEIMAEIIRADMEVMLKFGRNKVNIGYPDPVRPQWKN